MAREFKDSGIEWIGQIPKEWEIGKVKNYYSLQTGFTPDTKNELYYDDNGALWVNISDMGDSHYISNTKKKISDYYISKFKPPIVPKGSLLYSFKLSVGTVAIAGEEMYTNEAIAAFLQKDGINLSFLYYSSQVCIIFNANENIYGAKLLNQDLINNATIIFPPLAEQQKIADYLDKVCGEVDEMVTLQETMIEELKAYKQSVITEAVTKGLNPNVPMCDSGIDWIGEIPEHWEVIKMRRCVDSIGDVDHYMPDSIETGIPYIMTRDLADRTSMINKDQCKQISYEDYVNLSRKIILEKNDVIFARYASIGNVCYVDTDEEMIVSYSCVIIKPLPILSGLYLFYYLKSKTFEEEVLQFVNTNIQGNVGIDSLYKTKMMMPPLVEQRAIASYLDTKCSEIDSLIALKQAKIEELKEYKKSVIYEYVTGKKEVC